MIYMTIKSVQESNGIGNLYGRAVVPYRGMLVVSVSICLEEIPSGCAIFYELSRLA